MNFSTAAGALEKDVNAQRPRKAEGSGDRVALCKLLIQAHADVNASDAVSHETSLMEAAGAGDLALVTELLRAEAAKLQNKLNLEKSLWRLFVQSKF